MGGVTTVTSLYGSLQSLVSYVEENLKSKVTLDDLARKTSISKFHLSRIFHEVSKTSPMSYIRKRKLSSSLHELLDTNLKIIDISQEYGFDFEQSYIRSFTNTFGISPDRFRKEKPILKIQDILHLESVKEIGEEGIALNPPIVIKPGFYLTGPRYKIYDREDMRFHQANEKGNDFYQKRRGEIKNAVNEHIYFGYVENDVENTSYNYYTPSLQVTGPEMVPEGMVCHKVPTNKYAQFKYIGLHHAMYTHINNLLDTFKYIYGEWFPKSGYVQAAPYHFERIDGKLTRDDYCEVEIYIPVKLKS